MKKKKQIGERDTKCRACGKEDETRDHLWNYCSSTENERSSRIKSGNIGKDRVAFAVQLDNREDLQRMLRDEIGQHTDTEESGTEDGFF